MGPRPGRTRTAVDRVGRGKERQVNVRFLAMTNHYVFGPEFCSPAAGWEKGQVEKNVRDARHRFWQPMPEFPDLAALNDWLEQRCQELWREILDLSRICAAPSARLGCVEVHRELMTAAVA